MAGSFPLGGGGYSREAPASSVPPVHPSDAASFLYAARAGAGLQLWQQHPFYTSNIIRFSDDPSPGAEPSLTGGAASSSSSAARCCHQYDPLSYSRNFDFGTALDGNEACSFASRFVLAASAARQPQ